MIHIIEHMIGSENNLPFFFNHRDKTVDRPLRKDQLNI